jgi:LPXTG-motif cell wall-anchored protein
MSTIESAIFYIVGFLVAFAGLGFFVKYRRKTSIANIDGN